MSAPPRGSLRYSLCETCGRNVRVRKDGTFLVHKAADPKRGWARRQATGYVIPDCAASNEVAPIVK